MNRINPQQKHSEKECPNGEWATEKQRYELEHAKRERKTKVTDSILCVL